ncbi:anaerobic benzoate catabolism transcriptional regulator [Aquisphaera giovannonii]|uniref:Anaerobic benzoate catabolism transcriptional regulator n=1 Tax=Aquisphaera giovannonii TaxID=406548 RepID=A0A5B9W7G1_9BACT|nr:helix-turn-helix domain-containing protein [Aquisphaera giovannonii]QEH36287.1 anaerobic benzoate catabolism transcriptional regulator [Aquisphaera giovannonii]
MTSLAQRVRDLRYSKGWGPDELASRAEISRTALYQIESGKTGLPRAGTLQRIALALDVPMDELLADGETTVATGVRPVRAQSVTSRTEELKDWITAEGASLSPAPNGYNGQGHAATVLLDDLRADSGRFEMDAHRRTSPFACDPLLMREGELMSKLHDLIHSRMGSGVARIIDDLHAFVQRGRTGT